jgi:hypothetical protein
MASLAAGRVEGQTVGDVQPWKIADRKGHFGGSHFGAALGTGGISAGVGRSWAISKAFQGGPGRWPLRNMAQTAADTWYATRLGVRRGMRGMFNFDLVSLFCTLLRQVKERKTKSRVSITGRTSARHTHQCSMISKSKSNKHEHTLRIEDSSWRFTLTTHSNLLGSFTHLLRHSPPPPFQPTAFQKLSTPLKPQSGNTHHKALCYTIPNVRSYN